MTRFARTCLTRVLRQPCACRADQFTAHLFSDFASTSVNLLLCAWRLARKQGRGAGSCCLLSAAGLRGGERMCIVAVVTSFLVFHICSHLSGHLLWFPETGRLMGVPAQIRRKESHGRGQGRGAKGSECACAHVCLCVYVSVSVGRCIKPTSTWRCVSVRRGASQCPIPNIGLPAGLSQSAPDATA